MSEPVLSAAHCDALMKAALLAPTADNRPVCHLKWVEDGLKITDRGDFTHDAPHRRVLAWIAIGTMATNLSVRSRHLGLQAQVEWFQPARRGDTVASVAFSRVCAAADDALDAALSARCSNRCLDFRGPPLDAARKSQLENAVAAVHGATLHWLDDGAARQQALALIRRAETERFRVRSLHQELFESIRFDVNWSTSTTTGIPPGALGLPWIERLGFPVFRHWPVQRVANLFQAHRLLGWRAADLPCRLSPHLGVISIKRGGPYAAARAGQALQTVWLRATVYRMAFQVFAASPLYGMEDLVLTGASLQRSLQLGWSELCDGDKAFVAFRLGHAPDPIVKAGRPSNPTRPD